MLKRDLIQLVRRAQAEQDPRKRTELWRQVEEAGIPPDATVLEPVTGKEEKPDDRD